jgi:hypothetical protein
MNGALRDECRTCAGGLDHCHGTLVVHVDGALECTEPYCEDTDQVRHGLVIDCGSTVFGCCQARPVALTA